MMNPYLGLIAFTLASGAIYAVLLFGAVYGLAWLGVQPFKSMVYPIKRTPTATSATSQFFKATQ